MEYKNIPGILARFKKTAIALVSITSFFVIYNLFLVDHTLEDLRFSLEQTALAYSIEDLNGLDMVVTKTVAEEMPYYKIDTRNISNLEYAKNLVKTGTNYRQVDGVKVALKGVVERKEKKRGFVLSFLDRINRPVLKNMSNLARLYSAVVEPRRAALPGALKIDLRDMMALLDKEKNLNKAAAGYKSIIEKYPDHEKMPLVKLKLAYAHQRLGQGDKAIKVYKEVISQYPGQRESDIARTCLAGLLEKDKLLDEIDALIVEYNKLPKSEADERQRVAYDIGRLYTKMLNLGEAIKFFRRAVNINPSSDIAIKSRLAISWLYKQQNEFEKSAGELEKIIEERPGNEFINDVYYQIADTYHYQGKYEESVVLLQKIAEAYKREDPELAALYLFQAGASYMYDLNDTEKAEEVFRKISKEYPGTSYSKYLSPESPGGVFITYLVPRATRVVAWRMVGLLCISGYAGELCKFKAVTGQDGFNLGFNSWLKKELPDMVGNLYVEMKEQKTEFEKDRALTQGMITMGKFKVECHAEWKFSISKEKSLNLVVLKAFLDKLPIPPILLNRSLTGMERIIEKNIPMEFTSLSMDKDEIIVEGYGSRNILENFRDSTKAVFMTGFGIEDIRDPKEADRARSAFREKFPDVDFKSGISNDTESMFLDFFTRISLFLSFRILETAKDSKLDWERSIRTLGQLIVKRENFRVDLKQSEIIAEMSRYIKYEFPWLVSDNFLMDIKGLDLKLRDNGEIDFDLNVDLGYGGMLAKPSGIRANGTMVFEIDEESKIPKWVFKKSALNGIPFSVEKLNAITNRCFNILKDDRIPITIEEAKPYEGGMIFKGRGARDFTSRLFGDPDMFKIFQIKHGDLAIAGIKRLKEFKDADRIRGHYKGKLQKLFKPGDAIEPVKQYVK